MPLSSHEDTVHTEMLSDALTSTCTASEVQPRARTRTAMVASAAFMVTVDSSLRCSVLVSCCWCAQQVLSSVSAFPSVHKPPFKQFCPAARWSCDQRCYKWERSFSHGLMSSDRVLQGCKGEFINPSLTSSPVWLFFMDLWLTWRPCLAELITSLVVKQLLFALLMTKPLQPIVRKPYYSITNLVLYAEGSDIPGSYHT